MTPIRTVIADDHPLARRRLAALLAQEPDVEMVGECEDGRGALRTIEQTRPDLVFLDVQMPELDGFDIVSALGGSAAPPLVVFVTAYDEHALRAFDVHAVDYLLKPFSTERFRQALSHARLQLQRQRTEAFSQRLLAFVRDAQTALARPERFVLRTEGRVVFLDPGDVTWVESEGNYVRLYGEDGSHVLRETMKDMERRLGDAFVRIHRCHAVNVARIAELRACGSGEHEVVLHDGTRLRVGHRYRDRLEQRLRRA